MAWDWRIFGHEWAVELLAGQIARGQQRHAYLITGPEGVGRRTLALRFAQALNCAQPPEPGQPCFRCAACQQIERMQHPDLLVVQPEAGEGSQKRESIRIDQVRALQHDLALSPYQAAYKVGLLLKMGLMVEQASNALLKVLEEPAERAVLLLTADSTENVLPTILSRCETIRLRPVEPVRLAAWLAEAHQVDQEQALERARVAGGRPGFALALCGESEPWKQYQACYTDLLKLLREPIRERFQYVQKFNTRGGTGIDRSAAMQTLSAWQAIWRDVLIAAADPSAPLSSFAAGAIFRAIAAEVELHGARVFLASLERAFERFEANVNPRLVFETLLLDLPRLPNLPLPQLDGDAEPSTRR